MKSDELAVLKKIHLVIILLGGIMTPAVTATGAYYALTMKIEEKDREISERISNVQLNDVKNYVDKDSFEKLDIKVDKMSQDVAEIKAMMKSDRHR